MSRLAIDEPLRIVRSKRKMLISGGGKVGTTAGWVLGAANNIGRFATIPASQTASTMVVNVDGLFFGDIITGFGAIGQIESAGAIATLDMALRKTTAVAADISDALVSSMTQLSVTADTVVGPSNFHKDLAAGEVVGGLNSYYLLLTATTAAATDIDLLSVYVELQQR